VLWILATVVVCLVVIIVQLLLAFQKRATRLRVAQNPVRKQIGDYKTKLDDVSGQIRSMAGETLTQLKTDLGEYQRRTGYAANLTAELDSEAQAWVAEREGEDAVTSAFEDPPDHDDDDGHTVGVSEPEDLDDILGGRKDVQYKVEDLRANPLDLVRGIRGNLEDVYDYIEGLRTDANLVQQSLTWLGDDKNKKGANGSS
jgi:uncharacterized membrane-anchored protein YhcB (DUF1043 family)